MATQPNTVASIHSDGAQKDTGQTLYQQAIQSQHPDTLIKEQFEQTPHPEKTKLANQFVNVAGREGLNLIAATPDGQHALATVYSHSGGDARQLLREVHKEQGNTAINYTNKQVDEGKKVAVPSITATAVITVGSAGNNEPSFKDALQDKEFWKIYADKVQDLGIATGKMLLGEASVYSGWVMNKVPGGQVTGAYLMADGASLYAGGMSDVSNLFYGTSNDYDVIGKAYKNAGEYYFGDEAYGNIARGVVGLGSVFRANTIPVSATFNSSEWGSSALTYTKTVPAFYNSNNTLRAADAISVAQGVKSIDQDE
jgi:hypothetical protein